MEEAQRDKNDNQLGLQLTVEEVKSEFRKIGFKSKDLVLKLGNELEKDLRTEDICEEIKGILNDEIVEGLISRRNIERYCPDKWKKKTKPKKEKKNDILSFAEEKKSLSPMIINTDGIAISGDQYDHEVEDNRTNSCAENEEIEIDYIDTSDIKNFDHDKHGKNNIDRLEFEISLQSIILRKYIEDFRRGVNKISIHGTIQRSTSKIISAWVERPYN